MLKGYPVKYAATSRAKENRPVLRSTTAEGGKQRTEARKQ
jgi:hypothetical protein